MSWFDATGIASLAKTALKEAQKTIDKALDITDDDDEVDESVKTTTSSTSLNEKLSPDSIDSTNITRNVKQSASNPILSTVGSTTAASNLWGSFTGSFFDASERNSGNFPAVTRAPTSTSEARLISKPNSEKNIATTNTASGRTSSASESVEILSSPSSDVTTPSANIQQISSPSCITLQHSQQTTDSIEVLQDATSPSELISPDSVISTADLLSSVSGASISDSVEIIDRSETNQSQSIDDDDDSVSLSCNTLTESTIHEVQKPNKGNLSLNLQTVNETASFESDKTMIDIDDIQNQSTDDPKSMKTLEKTTLSVEKSFEGIDSQTLHSDSTHSFEDVQQMLLDETNKTQLKQHGKPIELLSPQSSNERLHPSDSDKKLRSEQNSGHTSADEIETATSSDIEIISGPNGDSSSQNSAAGIVTKSTKIANQYIIFGASNSKKKGHYRELSEASTYSMQSESGSDGFSYAEYEKLAQRINELNDVIEVRECKLVELGRENAQLFEQNVELKMKLDALQLRVESHGINSDDYTQRMSSLERKFQQTLRERDSLRVELKNVQASFTKCIPKDDLEKLIKEKDTMIAELRVEGEKLSKQILQHSNVTKKLRAKEKDSDATLKKQTEQIDELTQEVERAKKLLSAKEEVEKSQIQAIHKLTSEKQKLAKDILHVKSELDDVNQRMKTLQTSFDAAKKELNEKQQEHYTLSKKAKTVSTLQNEQLTLQQQNQQLTCEIEMLREQLKSSASEQSAHVHRLRQENSDFLRRLENAEQRSECQADAISEATIPLVKQCHSLQTTLNTRTLAWEKQEMSMLKKIEVLEKQLSAVTTNERSANEQSDQLNARILSLEEALTKALLRSEQSAAALQQKHTEIELKERDFREKDTNATNEVKKNTMIIDELHDLVEKLQQQLKDEQEKVVRLKEAKPRLCQKMNSVEFAEHSIEYDNVSNTSDVDAELHRLANNSSPSLSAGKMSANDSAWQLDEFDSISNVGRPSNGNSMYGTVTLPLAGGSAVIETLQSSLKQRDGENHQLHWQLSRSQCERNVLMSEVSQLTSQLEGIKDKLATHDTVVGQFTELQEQYDAILQMYGEKVEETQELQLDLQDVKDMYRVQIDDLLLQQRQLQKRIFDAQQTDSTVAQ